VTHFTWVWVGYWVPVPYSSLDVVRSVTDITSLRNDGSNVRTFTQYNGTTSGSIRERIIVTTSDDGLSITKQWTGSNAGRAINQLSSDVTIYNADGSTIRVVVD
jgi:hypothetical protein